jgi:hypothetical protein
MTIADAIRALYAQLAAPSWAAANLDALLDVLRDLSWLPAGPVDIVVPDLAEPDAARLRAVLDQAVADTAAGPRPVRIAEREPG